MDRSGLDPAAIRMKSKDMHTTDHEREGHDPRAWDVTNSADSFLAEQVEVRATQVLDQLASRLEELVEEWLHEHLAELIQLEQSIDHIVENVAMRGGMFSTSLTIVAASCCEQLAEFLWRNQSLAEILNGNGPIRPCLTRLLTEDHVDLPPPPSGSARVTMNAVIEWIVEASSVGLPRAREEISALADELSYHPAFFTVLGRAPGWIGLSRAHPPGYVSSRVGQVLLDNLLAPLVPRHHVDDLMVELFRQFGQMSANPNIDTGGDTSFGSRTLHFGTGMESPQVATPTPGSQDWSDPDTLSPTRFPPSTPLMAPANPQTLTSPAMPAPTTNANNQSAAPNDANAGGAAATGGSGRSALSPLVPHPGASPKLITAEWALLPDMSTKRNRCAAAAANGKVYVIGGYDGRGCLATCEALDPQLNTWVKVPSMPAKRDGCAAAAVDNKVYVIGGYHKSTFLDPIVFDVATSTWGKIPKMITKRGDCAATVWDRKVYAIGGYDGKSDLDSVECYDVDTRQWSSLACMSVRRSRCAAAAFDSRVFVFGGFDGANFWDTCEVLHLQSASWSSIPKMSVRRCDCAAAALPSGKLLVVGGYNGRHVWDIAELFDVEARTWSRLNPLRVKRANPGLVVVGNAAFVCGGFDREKCLASVEKLQL